MSDENKGSNGEYLTAKIVGDKRSDGKYSVHLDEPYLLEISPGKRVKIDRFHSSGGTLRQYTQPGNNRLLRLPVTYVQQKAESLYNSQANKRKQGAGNKKSESGTISRVSVDSSGMDDIDKYLAEQGFAPDSEKVESIEDLIGNVPRDDEDGSSYNLA